ncbi:hypothetical protein Fot_03776 [Forsythia ovata]|uniref:Uncharacterized protein n=1 Tax=Forsythia ovata TaxID=205694 RepID=A0ABD1XB72_9LAMI
MTRYGFEVEDYKKKVHDLTSLAERLESEVERRTKKFEAYKKDLKVERLRVDVHRLVTDLEASRAQAEEKEENLRRELDKKKKKINMFYIQQKSWDEGLALKNKELGILNGKVEAQGLTLAEMTTRVEAL